MYTNNGDYRQELVKTIAGTEYRIFIPANEATGYHMQRWVKAQEHSIYANAGGNKEVFQAIAEAGIDICENQPKANVRTDNAALWNNILYRLRYPVDADAGIRMGAMLSFMEIVNADGSVTAEPAGDVQQWWLQKKEDLCRLDPDMYAFFLSLGIANLPVYKQLFDTSMDQEYFRKRMEAIAALMQGIDLSSTPQQQ